MVQKLPLPLWLCRVSECRQCWCSAMCCAVCCACCVLWWVQSVHDVVLLIPLAVSPTFLSTSPQMGIAINTTENVTLNCSLQGYPLSQLQWRKNGAPLTPDGSHITITTFRRQDPTDTYPFSSILDSNFEPIPQEGLEYFEAVSELTLLPPIVKEDIAVYTCEVEGHFVQNHSVTSGSIFVNMSGKFTMHKLQLTIVKGRCKSLFTSFISFSDNYLPALLETSFRLPHLGGKFHNSKHAHVWHMCICTYPMSNCTQSYDCFSAGEEQ